MKTDDRLSYRALSVASALLIGAFLLSCEKPKDGDSWERVSAHVGCVDEPEELIGVETLCQGKAASGSLNARTKPFDIYGFEAPRGKTYEITLSSFGNPSSYDFDLYVLTVVSEAKFELLDESNGMHDKDESLRLDLDRGNVIRVEVEFHGQADVSRSYSLIIKEV